MLKRCSVRYFVDIHKLQTELGVFEAGRQLILTHSVQSLCLHTAKVNATEFQRMVYLLRVNRPV